MRSPSHIYGFLLPFLLFIVAGGTVLAFIEQGDALRFCSDNRSEFRDFYFYYGTKLGEEFVYILLTFLGIFISFRIAIMVPLTGIVVTIVSFVLKWLFSHKRPVFYFRDQGTLDELNPMEGLHLIGGYTSFPSGHTMSGFALFALVAIIFGAKKWWISFTCLILALTVGLSRIYLFQHFLKDVIFGALVGVLLAYLINHLFSYKKDDSDFWMNKNIMDFIKPKNTSENA